MAFCADVPSRNNSLTHSLTHTHTLSLTHVPESEIIQKQHTADNGGKFCRR